MPTIEIQLSGTSPLLMHNPQLSDPQNEWSKAMAAIHSKRKKTDEDQSQMSRLEWFGGLYTMPDTDGKPMVCVPTSWVRKCLIETGRIWKQGKQVERAVALEGLNIPLVYEGSRNLEELYTSGKFTSRLSVKVGTSRIMRVRPEFISWCLKVRGLFQDDIGLNFTDLERLVEQAGVSVGIGDNRVNGYGRFAGKVVLVK